MKSLLAIIGAVLLVLLFWKPISCVASRVGENAGDSFMELYEDLAEKQK